MTSLFDRVLDNFSMKELSSRVTAVIAVGFLICAASAAALYLFLSSEESISISGVGSFEEAGSHRVVVSLPADRLSLMEGRDEITVLLDEPANGPSEVEAKVLAINPSAPSVVIAPSSIPQGLIGAQSFDVTIVLVREPIWRLLWGGAAN